MLSIFAHAGENHEAVTTAVSHSLLDTWYISLLLFIVAISLATYLVYLVSNRSFSVTYNALLAMFFISGVLGYTMSPPISVLSLSIGFAMALLQVLTGLTSSSHQKGGKK
ncbi:hypothetical protein KC959_03490 [Candidatus Saccharibacteria bacterium]|nr:hypothetical protein [Candidatus Saccharibacteria bacterium]MCA9328810.1 hypothetical protein [Candidatus Saccharibacteria bacterium]